MVSMLEQDHGDFKFTSGQLDRLAVPLDPATLEVDPVGSHLQNGGRGRLAAPARQGLHTRQQLALARRLDEEVIGAGFECLHHIQFAVAMGQKYHWRADAHAAAQALENFVPRYVRYFPVEHNQVVVFALQVR
jgi:hypothetical protein